RNNLWMVAVAPPLLQFAEQVIPEFFFHLKESRCTRLSNDSSKAFPVCFLQLQFLGIEGKYIALGGTEAISNGFLVLQLRFITESFGGSPVLLKFGDFPIILIIRRKEFLGFRRC